MSDDLIKREDAIEAVHNYWKKRLDTLPTADIQQTDKILEHNKTLCNFINAIPSADRPQGEWEEKTTFHNADDNPIIEEWQSARCSVCRKYHTTPYMYYFDDYRYCPQCGAKMKGADDE